jgi:hypothetical protein
MDECVVDNTGRAVGNALVIPRALPPLVDPVDGGGQPARGEYHCELERESVIHNPQPYYYC